jgi:HTH-type transcriptional regulator, competence development regulator
MDFYEQLKDIRKSRGYTIREAASKSGVSPSYISQLENGNRGIPSPDILSKLAEGLDIPYTRLMEIAGYLHDSEALSGSASASSAAPRSKVELRQMLRDHDIVFDGYLLTDEDKQRILRMMKVLFWNELDGR